MNLIGSYCLLCITFILYKFCKELKRIFLPDYNLIEILIVRIMGYNRFYHIINKINTRACELRPKFPGHKRAPKRSTILNDG